MVLRGSETPRLVSLRTTFPLDLPPERGRSQPAVLGVLPGNPDKVSAHLLPSRIPGERGVAERSCQKGRGPHGHGQRLLPPLLLLARSLSPQGAQCFLASPAKGHALCFSGMFYALLKA